MKNVTAGILSTALLTVGLMGFSGLASAAPRPSQADMAKLFAKSCSGCHGDNAEGTEGYAPKLKNLGEYAVRHAIRDFQKERRLPEHKKRVAAFDLKTRIAMAQFLTGDGGSEEPIPAIASKKNVAQYYTRKCSSCHGEFGEGTDIGPRLRGQSASYMQTQFGKFAAGERPARLMADYIDEVNDDQELLKDLTTYLQAGEGATE